MPSKIHWLLLIISLPGQTGTPRMRVWRALKSLGAGILRDGVYVLPRSEGAENALQVQVDTVTAAGGSAFLLNQRTDESEQSSQFLQLFDRSGDYAEWMERAIALRDDLTALDEPEARRRELQLRRDLNAIEFTDYFPAEPKEQSDVALAEITDSVNRLFSPDEPTATQGSIDVRDSVEFQDRVWATRKNLWVDRVASAWLIRRFIDPLASFCWLSQPHECPDDAVGFDFDGATFSHIGERITFEVLLYSFALNRDSALEKIASLVHYLDVGGVPVAESAGFLAMLVGAKRQCTDDDALLAAVGSMLDHLYAAYSAEASTSEPA